MKLMRKSESRLMRLIGWLLNPFTPSFMQGFWTTIGQTIYVPTRYDGDIDWGMPSWRQRHWRVLQHEQIHVGQFKRWGMLLMAIGYIGPAPFLLPLLFLSWWAGLLILALLPLSVGLAYFRWRIERVAYLVQVDSALMADWASNCLWYDYLFTWPKTWMGGWFRKQLKGSKDETVV